MNTYDHTDALRSPMVSFPETDHQRRVRLALELVMLEHGQTLERLARGPEPLQRPAEPVTYSTDPHTRIGY